MYSVLPFYSKQSIPLTIQSHHSQPIPLPNHVYHHPFLNAAATSTATTMAADLALLFINQFHHQPHNPSSWMWNSRTNSFQPRETQEDNDSLEVRAFAEDTGNIMGSTWPPPSYTCTFCRREFRSAQALGGHMNVHRRDRARLNQSPLQSLSPASSSSSPLLFPTPQLVAGGAICLLYPFPAANTIGLNSPSTLVSISPSPPAINFPFSTGINTSSCRSVEVESTTVTADANGNSNNDESGSEELDLELRLGRRPPQHY